MAAQMPDSDARRGPSEFVVKQRLLDGEDEVKMIQQACKEGYTDTVEYLLSLPHLDVGRHALACLDRAVGRSQTDVVRLLLKDPRIDPSVQNCQVVRQAARFGYTDIIDLFLQDSRVVGSGGNQAAFDGTVAFGDYSLFERLVNSASVDPSHDENHAIRAAASRNDAHMVNRLLQESCVDPSAKNNEALIMAACMGHEKTLCLLVADARIYIDGTIPTVSQQQSQPYYNSPITATRLIRNSILQMLASGDLPFDAEATLSPDTLDETDIGMALEVTHEKSLISAQIVMRALLGGLSSDIVTEILWILFKNSLFPCVPSPERRTRFWQLVIHT